MANHNSFYTFNLFLAAPPLTADDFSVSLVIVEEPVGFLGSWLGAAGHLDFTSKEGVDEALDAPMINQDTADKLYLAFAQIPSSTLRLVSYDTVAAETAETAFDTASADPSINNFWGVVAYLATGATTTPVLNISLKMDARKFGTFLLETDETTLTSGDLAASTLSALAGKIRTGLVFNDSAESHAAAIYSKTLGHDLESKGPAFAAPFVASTGLNTQPTTAQYNQLITNNVNLVSEAHTYKTVFMPGVLIDGRGISEVLFADYVTRQLSNGLKVLHITKLDRGEPISIDLEGQAMIKSEFSATLLRMVTSKKIVIDQYLVKALSITQSDRDNGRLRFEIAFQVKGHAIRFGISVYADRAPVIV